MKSLLTILCFAIFCFSQDTVSITSIPTSSGALIGTNTKYSPTIAYNGMLIDAKHGIIQILTAPEMQQYAWRDTTARALSIPMGVPFLFPDSVWTQKEQAWICSLTVHGKYRMRCNIVLDSLCKVTHK